MSFTIKENAVKIKFTVVIIIPIMSKLWCNMVHIGQWQSIITRSKEQEPLRMTYTQHTLDSISSVSLFSLKGICFTSVILKCFSISCIAAMFHLIKTLYGILPPWGLFFFFFFNHPFSFTVKAFSWQTIATPAEEWASLPRSRSLQETNTKKVRGHSHSELRSLRRQNDERSRQQTGNGS